jgi:hypothetical protein
LAALALAAGLLVLVGCGGGSGSGDGSGDAVISVGTKADRPAPAPRERPAPASVQPSHCDPGVPECATTEGEIFYVEEVDPDGDGDAHFVIFDSQGITLPGMTAIDVRKGLRPHPLPGPGDLISAAGPVQTGSYGQSQIHALELHVAGR